MSNHNEWVKDRPNILAQENLAIVADALKRGFVFGQHCHYCSGSSLDHVVFQDFDQYRSYISHSRPGDLYYMWSVADLVARGLVLAHRRVNPDHDRDTPVLSPTELDAIKKYLDMQANEFVYLVRDSGALEIGYGDIEQYESFSERMETCANGEVEVIVFPLTTIDVPDYYLLKAKYPNADGEVPVGGTY